MTEPERWSSHVNVISSIECPPDELRHDVTRTQPCHLDYPHPAAVTTITDRQPYNTLTSAMLRNVMQPNQWM